MDVATFKFTLALPVEEAPLSEVINFLTTTVEIPENQIIGVYRVGVQHLKKNQIMPLWDLTLTEEGVAKLADWLYYPVDQFEMNYEVEWKTYAGV